MIPDSHNRVIGLKPVLFSIGGVQVGSYAFFMLLGVFAALLWYSYQSSRVTTGTSRSWPVIAGALLFGSLGAKLAGVLLNSAHYSTFGLMQFLYSGRSILGGLILGWVGVKLTKRVLGITGKYGNAIAPAAALGIAIGRIGCFLGSCCYGKPTDWIWGVNFGDGVMRHPTQVYEAIFSLGLCAYLSNKNRFDPEPGVLFRHFLILYFAFRFFIEFIRTEPTAAWGLTVFQVFAGGMVMFLLCLEGVRLLYRHP